MSLDLETVKRIAILSRLKFSQEKGESIKNDLNRILGFVEQLDQVNTDGVEPMVGVGVDSMPMRDDVVTDGGYVERVVANSPEKASNMFVVPKVVE